MSYRDLVSSLQTSLTNNESHRYLHLIKFEKPSTKTELDYKEGSKASQKANTYAYMSDGAFEVDFNDGSTDANGNANGVQTYLPNKVLSVGTINETIEAKASTMSLSLAATALSAAVSSSFTFTSSTITGLVDLEQAGFSAGDTIEFSASGEDNDGLYVRIDGFENENKRISYTVIDGSVTFESSVTYTASYASSEIDSLTLAKSSTNYSSYLNREVFIYRAHINPSTGSIIGSPFLIFKGIITNANLQDDPTKGSKITWSLTSHWGDFVQVVGRITSDHSHRGLDTSGVSQDDAVFRPEYAGDYGFRHAEQAVNIVATYQVPETRFKMKRRGGIAGMLGGKRIVEYTVMVDRDVDLEFNLGAKYIPVVYGVQKVSGTPIFADGDSTNAQKVYIAQAISEGPIHGVLDLHIDSNPVICINGPDSTDRSGGDAQVQCVGRADRGDVLTGGSSINASGEFSEQVAQIAEELLEIGEARNYSDAITQAQAMVAFSEVDETSTGGAGITHEKKFNLNSPLDTEIQFHAGTPTQQANSFFAAKGLAGGFKVQSILYRDKPRSFYWSPEHRLLDTAYCTMNFTIQDGEFTIPDFEFIVKGRILECFNYDYSYSGSGTASNFKLGDIVTLHKTTDDSQLGSTSVQIIDKWSFYGPTGTLKYRYRFDKNYQLESVRGDSNGDVKNFYMKDSANNKFFFSAYNAAVEDINSNAIENNTFQNRTTLTSTSHPTIAFNSFTRFVWVTEEIGDREFEAVREEVTDYRLENLPTGLAEFSLGKNIGMELTFQDGRKETVLLPYNSYSSGRITFEEVDANTTNYTLQARNKFNRATSWKLFSSDTAKLDSNSSTVDDTYNGQKLVIREKDSSQQNIKQTITRVISDYVGATKLVKFDTAITLNTDSSNTFDYTVEGDINITEDDMFAAFEDKRVSINPAIQLLDYLTNKRYGKGLDLENDIDLDSFLATARACDQRSKISIITSTNPGNIKGNTYRYPASGDLLFQGVVDEVPKSFTAPDGNTYYEITFTDVIGKLVYRWSDGRTFYPGEVLYHEGTAFTTPLSSPQIISTTLKNTYLSSYALDDTTNRFTLRDTDNNADLHIFLNSGDNFGDSSGNPVIRKNSGSGMNAAGYSLYDSDDCKYWVYLGWDEPEQRYVTRHQTNFTVDTSQSVFNNINGMLNSFNGMLRYSNGKYVLALKTAAPADTHFTSTFPVKDISEDELIGQVKVSDSGSKKTFNSINATIVDPANKFGGRGITFMNSQYLKQDRGVKKQGNYNIPGITNYFNARMNIKQLLDESRYGLTINFTIDQKGYLLLAGDIIRLTYSRFGWENKFFRINSLNFQANGLVQVVADEHNDTAFIIDHLETGRTGATLEGGNQGSIATSRPKIPTSVASPLTATTTDRAGYVELRWVNGLNFNNQAHRTQIGRATTNPSSQLSISANVEIIAEVQTDNYIDNTDREVSNTNGVADSTSYYYWVRHIYNTTGGERLNQRTEWLPLGQGIALPITQTEIDNGVTINNGGVTFANVPSGTPTIRAGITGLDSGNSGFFLGYDGSNHVFQVGDPSGNNLKFDGTDLALTGSEFTVTASGATTPSITGTTTAGKGSLLKADGDVFFGDSAGFNIFFDQSEGTLTLTGEMVTEDNITTNAITADKISANSINADKIAANSITADQIAANSITTDQLAANSITTDQLAANSITTDQLAANSITADQITANSVVSSLITASTILSSHIKSNSIVATIIDAESITAADIQTATISALSADLGDITAGTMKGGSIPDANNAPGGSETGAFMDLNAGKMVFGNASKHILFDGTDLILSGVTIDAQSIVNANAPLLVKEDGTTEAASATSLNFTSGLNVTVAGDEATINLDVPTDNNFTTGEKTKLEGISTGANAYVLPVATTSTVGGVSIGARLTVDGAGDISADIQSDNNFTTTLLSKLNAIEPGATGDQTAAEIRSLVEGATNSNVFTDDDHSKLNAIEPGATGDQTAAEIRTLVESALDSNVFTDDDHSKLNAIEPGATADQTAAEIRSLVEGAIDSNVFTDDDHSKLDAIEEGANAYVLPTNNVTNASVTGSTLTLSRENADAVTFTDTNTQYTAGTGLGLSGTEFSVNSSVVRTTGTQTIGGAKTFTGNVTFSGTTTYINTTTLNVGDNIITLNADFTGTNPTESAGIEIERGTEANALFQYKESGVGITGDLAAGWSVGSSRLEATGFYGTFYGDASNLSNINADSLSGLSTADLAEDPSATTSSGTMYFTNARARAALSGSTGITYNSTTGAITNSAPDQTVSLTGGGATTVTGTYPSFTISSTDNNTVPNNATITISAGTELSTGGDFTTDQGSNETITINHANVSRADNNSSASPGYGDSFTAIDSITTNARGHVTAVNTKTVTIPASDNTDTDTITQIREDSGSYRTGSITLQSGTNVTITEPSAGVFNFASTDNNTVTQIREDSGTYRSGDITLQSGTNVTITEPSAGVFNFASTNTNTTNFNIQADGGATENISAGETINFIGSGTTSVSRSGNSITISSSASTNNYVDGATFNTGNGIITLSRSGLNAVTVDIDGRFINNTSTQPNNIYIRNTSPTIYLRDQDHISSMIHQNSNLFYILRADAADDASWTTFTTSDAANGRWPLQMNLTDTGHYFYIGSPNVQAGGHTVWHAGNDGPLSGLNADVLDSQDGSYYLDYNNFDNTPSIPSAANNATITLNAGSGLTTGGSFTTDQGSNETISFHVGAGTGISVAADTVGLATAGPGAGSYGSTGNSTKIDTITLDAYGRVTAVATGPIDAGSTGTVTSVSVGAGTGLSGGGTVTTSGTITLDVDLNELTIASVAESNDHLVIVKNNGATRKMLFSEFLSDQNILTGNVTGTLFTDVIVANSIETDMLKANTITADKIAANLITASKIAADSITAQQLQVATESGSGIYMELVNGNGVISIKDGSTTRVKIGYLGT